MKSRLNLDSTFQQEKNTTKKSTRSFRFKIND